MIKIKKHTWFLIGITIGLIVGIFVARNFIPAKNIDYINIDFKKSQNTSDDNEKNQAKTKEPTTKSTNETFDRSALETENQDSITVELDSANFSDSVSSDSLINPNLLDSLDMDSIWSWEDTITIDTNNYTYANIDEEDSLNSKLLKDELFEVRYIIPSGKKSDFECDSYNELDSVLVDNYRGKQSQEFRVEFWKSPLNYRAYILTKNKLVLFGILKPDEVSLAYQADGKIQLKYFDMTFELVCTKDLKPTILK